MSFIIKVVRNLLGALISLIDIVTRPSKIKRDIARQSEIEGQLDSYSLYQHFSCPFCIKTRRALHKLNLPIETKNVSTGSPYRQELLEKGGKIQVPCLRIEENGKDIWMYESSEIIGYLNKQFAN